MIATGGAVAMLINVSRKILRKKIYLHDVTISLAAMAAKGPGLPDGFFSDQKITNWVYFGGPWNVKCCYIFWSFGIFQDHWVFLCAFGNFGRFGLLYK
jgi:hypothetical protein